MFTNPPFVRFQVDRKNVQAKADQMKAILFENPKIASICELYNIIKQPRLLQQEGQPESGIGPLILLR